MKFIAVFVVGLFSILPGLSLADSGFVEGTVFNKKTGVPLAWAQVSLYAYDVPLCPGCPVKRIVGKPALTDGNGFFSIEVTGDDLNVSPMRVVATCLVESREKTSDPNAHWVHVHPGVEIRNLYIDASRWRWFDTCDGVSFPFELTPVPPTR